MSTFKATNKRKTKDNDVFKATSQRSYDSALVGRWESGAKASFEALKKYSAKIGNNEYLSKKDLEDYKSAMDSYVDNSNRLRKINSSFGKGYSEDEEKQWADYISTLQTDYNQLSKHYSKFKNELEYNDAVKIGELYALPSTEIEQKMGVLVGETKAQIESLQSEYNRISKNLQQHNRGNTKYSSTEKLNAARKRKESLGKQISKLQELIDGGGIAYTTSGGQNITWSSLYKKKKDEEDFNALYSELSANPDWAEQSKYKPTYDTSETFGIYNSDFDYEAANRPIIVSASASNDKYYATQTTEQEKELFNYLAHTKGTDYAIDWLMSREDVYKERLRNQGIENARKLAKELPVLSDALAVASSIVTPFEYLGNVVTGNAGDRVASADFSSTIYSTRMEQIDWEIGGWDAFDFLYSTGTSLAESVLATATFGKLGGVTLGMNAAAHGTNDALDRGMSKGQAFTSGLASGIFEGVFETWSIGAFDDLTKNLKRADFRNLAKYIGKNMWNNAKEETLTEIANMAYDYLANGDFSQYETAIRQYMASGMSEADAKLQVAKELGVQVAEAAGSGALMGFGFGVGGGVNARHNIAQSGRVIKDAGQVRNLVDLGKSLGEGTNAYEYADKITDKSRGFAIGNLLGAVAEGIPNANKADMIKAFEEKGYNTKEANLLVNKMFEQGLDSVSNIQGMHSPAQDYNDVLNDPNSTVSQRNEAYEGILRGVAENRFQKAMGKAVKNKSAIATHKASAEEQGNLSAQEENPIESKFESNLEGKDFNSANDKIITSKKLIKSDKDNMAFEVTYDDGTTDTVDAKNINFGNEGESLVYSYVMDMNLPVGIAESLVGLYKGNDSNSAAEYISGMREAFVLGKHNQEADLRSGQYASQLTEEQRSNAFKLGQIYAKEKAVADEKAIKGESKSTNTKKQEGKVHFEGDKLSLKSVQDVSLESLGVLSKALGKDFHIFESYKDANGNRVYKDANGNIKKAPNGFYNQADGSIWIDLNAGKHGEGMMLYTVAHELTHFIKQWSPTKFKALADFLVEQYGKEGVSVADLVREQQDKAKRNRNEELSYDEAFEEMVADSMETMLTDGKVIRELAQKDKGLFNKIKSWIDNLLRKLKKEYKNYSPDSQEGQMVLEMEKTFKQIQELFADALADASDNFAIGGQKNTTSKGDVKFEIRYPQFESSDFEKNFVLLSQMQIVKKLSGNEFAKSEKPLSKRVMDYFNSLNNNVYSDLFGDVALTTSSMRDDIYGHGRTSQKITAFAAIPEVIQQGVVIDSQKRGNGSYDRIIVAAPITIGEEKYFMGVMLQRDHQSQRLYLHDVVAVNEKETMESPSTTPFTSEVEGNNDSLYMTSILKKALNVKGISKKSQEKLSGRDNTIGERNLEDFAEAKNIEGKTLFQYRAMESDEDVYREMLKTANVMSDSEIDGLFDTVDRAMDIIRDNLEILDYAWDTDIDDRAFNPVKPNTDKLYQVSVDFSTLCRKRLLQQSIQAHLQEALNRPLTKEEGIAIRDALMTIQEEGKQIEIACALCYVESARMKSPAQIKRFIDNRETVIKDFFATKSDAIKVQMKQAEAKARKRLGVDDTPLTKLPSKAKKEIRNAKKEVRSSYTPTTEESKLIEVAKGMSVNDFVTPAGLENLIKNYPSLFDAYASYIVNATHSKGIENDTWWRAGDSKSIGDTLISNMNAENGLRSQSWSDFQVIHLLDYIAATIELSTRNAKMQAYSKVPDYVELMGNTGEMINLSLIPTRHFNGVLEFDSVEGMAFEESMRLRDKYHSTAGTIAIGVDDKQIQMLLADTNIDYVIPYHKSGMSKAVRKAMHIPTWSQYEEYQSEKNLSRDAAKKQAEKYGAKLLSESDSDYQKHPNFSEWFDIQEARQIAKLENSNPSDKAMAKKYGVMYGGYKAMQNAANNYLKVCAERGISPKFSHENANFTTEDNYWKLLIDRKMIDNVTGEVIEQQAVKPIFDQNEVLRILNDELKRYPSVKADQDYATRKVTENFLSGNIRGGMSAEAIAKVMKKPVDNIAKVNILSSVDSETKLSDRDSEGNELSKEQQEFFKDSKVRDENGNLLVVYHGTPKGNTTIFDKSKTSKENDMGQGIYFSTNSNDASEYMGKSRYKKLYGAYVNIKKPFVVSNNITMSIADARDLLKLCDDRIIASDVYRGLQINAKDGYITTEQFANTNISVYMTGMLEKSKKYDGIIDETVSTKFGLKEGTKHIVVISPEQIKETSNENPTSNPDIRYSERDYVAYDMTAILKESTIDKYLRDYAAPSTPNYAQAYITYMRPDDFLALTTSGIGSQLLVENETKEFNREEFEDYTSNQIPINLVIDHESGEVTSHEGRHRMVALSIEDIHYVPVLLFDYGNKYNKENIDELKLIGQFNEFRTAIVRDAIPLSYANRDAVIEKFGTMSKRQQQNEKYGIRETLRYSDRDTESVSTRSLLANALEGAVKNEIEKNKLALYKEKIALIESEQKKLHKLREKLFTKGIKGDERRELQQEVTRTANRINTYDRQLFNLESTTALKNVLTREKELVRKRQKQKDAENLKAYKEKVAETTRQLLKKNEESRKKAVEGRKTTMMRHKVKNVVNDLNKLLLKPTKERHIPEELRIAVAEALAIVNMDTVDADARVAKYNELIAKAKDPDIIASLTETRDRILNQGNKLGEKLTKLKDAYAMINASADGNLKSLYDDVIYSKIEKVQKDVGKTPLRNMTLKQLEDVYELYEMVLTTVRDSNEAFAENLKMTRQALGSNTFAEIKESNKAKDRIRFEGVKNFGWMYLKPMLAIKKIGSATLQKLWNNILYGQEVFAQDYDEAVKFAKEMKEKYGYSDWDLHKLYSFESKSGKVMKINLEQMMSIYAYSKRKQADEHIEFGGILLNESIIKVKNKLGKTVEYKVNDSTAYRLDKMQVGEIIATLEKEAPGAKDFVDEMQKYLSETMGEKGNEVSMKMYGIKLFKEEHYFPLKSSKDFMEAANAKLKGDVKIKNKGMTKATVEHAQNPIVLEGFLDVWGNHINEMAMYHGLVLPLEDFSRTLNYGFKADDKLNTDAESVKTALRSAFGKSADNYLNELLKAINGGVLHDSSDGIANKMISTFKKSKVMASLSVIVQQPTAIIRAMGKIEPKYFVAQNFHHNRTWEELKKYCPTAIIKETGSFDTNMGRTIVDMIKEDRKFTEKVGDTLGKAPAWMDEMGWNMIWRALKKKVATEQGLSGEELLKECGKQMTLIINETQVYDSVMSRNELMRSKGALTKMATAFMGEPTTVANMIYGAALDIKRGNKKMAGKTVAAVISSVVINGLVSSLVYALRDDDEDETFLEKYLESATTEVIEGFNPLTYIPYVKDAYSLFQGYDVERTDIALIGDVADAVNEFFNVFDPEAYEGMSRSEIAKHIYESSVPLLTSICDMFGLPVGNILRDAKAIIVNDSLSMSKTSGEGIGLAIKDGWLNSSPKFVQNFVDDKKYHKLYLIANNGDTKYVKTEVDQMVAEKFDTYKSEEDDEEKAEKKAKQSVKSSFTAVYRDEYKKAYKNKDAKEMNRIRKFLYATGLWDYLSELDELLAKWREEA